MLKKTSKKMVDLPWLCSCLEFSSRISHGRIQAFNNPAVDGDGPDPDGPKGFLLPKKSCLNQTDIIYSKLLKL